MPTVADTSLSEVERRVLERAVELLRERFGGELISVWLYGSRARGEAPRHEDSDVDLMVVVKSEPGEVRVAIGTLLFEAAKDAGGDRFAFASRFQPTVVDPAYLAHKRSIGEFFVSAVDRDKVVLYGDPDGGADSLAGLLADAVERRTEEYMTIARGKLDQARRALEFGASENVAHDAYYAAFHAARAALSSEDAFTRTHSGTWDRFHVLFVESARIAKELAARARNLEDLRLDVDYRGLDVSKGEAVAAVETTAAFLTAIDRAVSAS